MLMGAACALWERGDSSGSEVGQHFPAQTLPDGQAGMSLAPILRGLVSWGLISFLACLPKAEKKI